MHFASKISLSIVALIASASVASAGCFGTDSYYTCNDSSGNRYSVQKYGDTTYMRGNNYSTGSSWSQRSTSYGDMTTHTGRDADGNSWRSTCFAGKCR